MRSYQAKRQIRYTIWFNWENFNLTVFNHYYFQNILFFCSKYNSYLSIYTSIEPLEHSKPLDLNVATAVVTICSAHVHLCTCQSVINTVLHLPSEHSFSSTGYIVIPYCTHLLQILLWITKRDTVIPYKYMNYIWCWPNKLILHTPKFT